MSSFAQAFDDQVNLVVGENGNLELNRSGSTFQSSLVDLMYKLLRGINKEDAIDKITYSSKLVKTREDIIDLFVLCFNTRATRNVGGGKGERDIFYWFFTKLAKFYVDDAKKLIELIPFYGRWSDLIEIAWQEDCPDTLAHEILLYLAKKTKHLHDEIASAKQKVNLNDLLIFKWLPSEGKKYYKSNKVLWEKLVLLIVSEDTSENSQILSSQDKKKYREILCFGRDKCNIVERFMSSKEWDKVETTKIPAGCMMKHSKALLNEKVKDICPDSQFVTGNRYPNDPERVRLRLVLMEKILKGNLAKNQELISVCSKIATTSGIKPVSKLQKELVQQSWNKIKEEIVKNEKSVKSLMRPGSIIPMADVSGSMTAAGVMVHSIALSILLAEINKGPFHNRVLTFESQPTCVSLEGSLYEKFGQLFKAPWGGSTNIWKAIDLIYHIIRENKVPPEEVPEWLAVFSDLQFDEAVNEEWSYTQRILQKRHEDFNQEDWVVGRQWKYKNFRILFWNLRGDTSCRGIPAKSDEDGVVLWSGYNPSMFRVLMFEDAEQEEETAKVTPEEVLNKILHHKDFTSIRNCLK